jgi:hypothetical protein
LIFTQKQKKYFKYSLYTIIIYIISLHPVSGIWGGIVFFIIGWAIPTITNFLLAYFLLLFFPEKLYKLFKLFIFILLSFILGVNIKIPYIFTIFHSYDIPEINSIKIIHPLSSSAEPVYFRSGKVEFKVDGHIKLKKSFFGSVEISGNEGCMCMYFEEPYTPLTGNREQGLGIFDKLGAIGANSINYRFDQIIPNNNGIVVYTTIKDVKGGHIIVQSTFPKGLGYTDTSFDHGGGDRSHFKKYFWRYMFFNLINDNIWQKCLSRLEKTKVSDPLESLLKLKKETYLLP